MSIERSVTADADDDLPPLVEQVRAGDDAALERLISRVLSRVQTWALRFTGDPDEAEDVAQDVLAGLGRRVRRFDRQRRFSTWLFVVTRRVALSAKRRDVRRRGLAAGFLTTDVASAASASDDHDAGDASTLNALVLGYFDALPAKQRLVFELADLRGMSSADIARELGMRPSTVRANLFKARASIRRRLMENHEALVRDYHG